MKRTVICPYCGKKNPYTEERCLSCGGSLPETDLDHIGHSVAKREEGKRGFYKIGVLILGAILILATIIAVPFILLSSDETVDKAVEKELSSSIQETAELESRTEPEEENAEEELPNHTREKAKADNRTESTEEIAEEELPNQIQESAEAENLLENGKYSLSPPYQSYHWEDYALPEEREYSTYGSSENGLFSMKADKVRRAPYLKYSSVDMMELDPQERDTVWRQALNSDLLICELTLTNLSGADIELYTPDFKATVQNGSLNISRPGMENVGPRGMPLGDWTLLAGESKTFVATFPIESSSLVVSIDYVKLMEGMEDQEETKISIPIPIDPLR